VKLFARTAVVIVDTVRVENLRVSFKVHKDGTGKPNTAEVTIFNLSDATRSVVEKKGAPLIVQAGYGGQNTTLFSGRVRTCDHTRKNADWETVLKSGDGEQELKFATISNSWRPGVPVTAVIKALVAQLGLDPGDSATVYGVITGTYLNGCTLHGPARQHLSEILGAYGFDWSVQDGRVQVVKRGQASVDAVVELSPESGLLGSPTHGTGTKASQVSFESLLQAIRPGQRVKLVSRSVNGLMRALIVDHEGDTHGTDWKTKVEAAPL